MSFATINGIQINYVVQGSGPHLILFAPGAFRSVISRWTAQGNPGVWKDMNALETLSRDFTVIAYDRREAGLSGGRIEPLSWDLYVREVEGLLDYTGARQAYVLGACMGASLAMAFARRHPSRCRGLLLHWPVGGYRWMVKARGLFTRHIAFVRAQGLAAVVERAPKGENFFLDPEIGPWGSPAAVYPEFAAELMRQDVDRYIEIVEKSRDALFRDTMPSGLTGEDLMAIQTPALVMSGADDSHPVSAAWTVKELMPAAELWDVIPPHQTAQNTLEQILRFAASH